MYLINNGKKKCMKDRKKDLIENHFGNQPTALLFVKFVDGIFINIDTGEPIGFNNNSLLKIRTELSSIKDENYEEITKEEVKEMLSEGTYLHFSFSCEYDAFHFYGILTKPLIMSKKNNKDSLISRCSFRILTVNSRSIHEELDLDFSSLNQAFFQMSIKYRPENKSHVCNVYKTFRTEEGRYLEDFRF
jgi:hypothetical protein